MRFICGSKHIRGSAFFDLSPQGLGACKVEGGGDARVGGVKGGANFGEGIGEGSGASVAGTGVGVAEAPQAVKKMESKRVRDSRRFMDSP